jgi:hypothetical protein
MSLDIAYTTARGGLSGETADGGASVTGGWTRLRLEGEMRTMRKRIGWLLLAAALLAAPLTARAQDQGYYVPPVDFTGPFSHPRYEGGGFYVGLDFLYMRQTRPLRDQVVAVRGFTDFDGSLTGVPGTFVGSGREALNVDQLRGPGSFQPGLNLFFGWRFESGIAVELRWMHLSESRYAATAGPTPPGFSASPGNFLEDTFLYSPVSNFPINFAGTQNLPDNLGTPGTTFGIWNAASLMTIDFRQRFELFEVNTRVPVWQTDTYRTYGLFGPRAIILWERFGWRTVDVDPVGMSVDSTSATYSNITSNRLYGLYLGTGHDWFLGNTPIGAFSTELDVRGALYIDFIKERAAYDLGDRSVGAHRSINQTSLVPGFDGRLGMKWYPWEAISLSLGYNVIGLFNTYSSPRPIDFNYGTVDPKWEHTFRFIHGIDVGISFVF